MNENEINSTIIRVPRNELLFIQRIIIIIIIVYYI